MNNIKYLLILIPFILPVKDIPRPSKKDIQREWIYSNELQGLTLDSINLKFLEAQGNIFIYAAEGTFITYEHLYDALDEYFPNQGLGGYGPEFFRLVQQGEEKFDFTATIIAKNNSQDSWVTFTRNMESELPDYDIRHSQLSFQTGQILVVNDLDFKEQLLNLEQENKYYAKEITKNKQKILELQKSLGDKNSTLKGYWKCSEFFLDVIEVNNTDKYANCLIHKNSINNQILWLESISNINSERISKFNINKQHALKSGYLDDIDTIPKFNIHKNTN